MQQGDSGVVMIPCAELGGSSRQEELIESRQQPALPRRKFCKSLISGWFPYSNQSCCAAPILG